MGKRYGENKGKLYSRRIIETSGENKEYDKFRLARLLRFGLIQALGKQEEAFCALEGIFLLLGHNTLGLWRR